MSEAAVSRRLAVILAADIVGYSRLMAEDETGTLAALDQLRRLLATLVDEHDGRIFNLAGDGTLAEFASPVQAVRAAVAIQRALARRNSDLPERRRLKLRIGINLGDVVVQGDDLLGDGVNIAARLQGLAEPQQICIAASVYDQIEGKIAFPLTSLGEQRLKNLPRPILAHLVDWTLDAPRVERDADTGALPLPDRPSIAVLPFANVGQDPSQDYFADGLTEDLITALAKYRWFFVIGRNSSFTYKGRAVTAPQVGRDLGVAYVIEGSVRRSGDRVRVTVQLIEARTGHHLWADRYDRDLTDLFALQDEIVDRVAAVIEPGMMRSEAQRRGRGTSGAMSAWDLVFQGMWYFHHWRREHHHTACELFRRAIAADPLLPAGHIWLCRGLDGMRYYGWSTDLEADLREETAAAERIQQFGEEDPYALYAITIQANAVGNSARAIDAAQRTIDLCPSFALGHVMLGVSRIWAGRAAAAIEPLQRGLRLNPSDTQSFQWVHFVGLARLLLGDLDQALEKASEAVALRPDIYCSHLIRTVSLSLLGRDADAREALDQMRARLGAPMIVEQYLGRFKSAADRALVEKGLRRAKWNPGS